jgi:threonine dehydrogenase-like Zn-dependent dehydrogenase
MGESISADILAGLEKLIVRILGGGKGVDDIIKTTGDSSPHAVLSNVDRIVPAFTMVNNGSATINFGSGGAANHPLPVGMAVTYRWKNPKYAQIVVNDLGTAAKVDVFG